MAMCLIDAKCEAVESRSDATWQFCFQIRVRCPMSQVCQERTLGPDRARGVDSFRNAQVGRMLGPEQRVYDQHFDPAKRLDGVGRKGFCVGHVAKRADAISNDVRRAVW